MKSLNTHQSVVGIVERNSLEYIRAVFEAFGQNKIVVTLKSENDKARLAATSPDTVIAPANTTGWIKLPTYNQPDSTALAQVLFTSGTEGEPKGILLNHGMLANTTARLIAIQQVTGEIKEYVGVPVYFSFGFGRIRLLSEVGGQCYLPEFGFSPTEFASMLESGEVNALSAVPTLLRLVLLNEELFAGCGSKLRWMEIGSQYMSRAEKEALKRIFPSATIIQHYGLTEASRTTFLKVHEETGSALESVGRCYDGVEVRLSDSHLIEIKGPHIAQTMLVGGEIKSIANDGWLTTSDQGHFENGLLYFDGRADDIINCGGIKVSPDTLQAGINERLQLGDVVAVAKIPDEMRGESVLISYLKEKVSSESQLKEVVQKTLEDAGLTLGGAVSYFPVEQFPKTKTGKLQRKELAKMYQQPGESTAIADEKAAGETGESIKDQLIAIWTDVLKIKELDTRESFFDLGGDSLSAIRISTRMEKLGIPKAICQEVFRGKTIDEIAQAHGGEGAGIGAGIGGRETGAEQALAQDAAELTEKLVTIWQQVLKIEPVSTDESFFDLGGDSLSAIRISTRMEKLGISKVVCQEVFRGKTIAQIVAAHTGKLTDASDQSTALAGTSLTDELVAIWKDVLKIDAVDVHESFFDLGGDSLSAIRISTRMEKLGIPKSVCQEVFRGKTIEQICSECVVDGHQQNATQIKEGVAATTDKLVEIWEDILKISPVSTHESFFDLGGDSLSAIRISTRMEKLGLPKAVCQQIFQGKTIAEIADQGGVSSDPGSAGVAASVSSVASGDRGSATATALNFESAKSSAQLHSSDASRASKSIDITRGILVLAVISSHWMPGIIERLPSIAAEINQFFAPFYSAGTPGFAIVFGVTVGYFYFHRFQKHPRSIQPMLNKNAMIMVAGVVGLAAVRFVTLSVQGAELAPIDISNLFWSPITYYLTAMLTLPLWLMYMKRFGGSVLSSLCLALGLYMLHVLFADLYPITPSKNPFVQPLVLLATAKFSYFELSAGAFLGVAIGRWIRECVDSGTSIKGFVPVGAFLVMFSVVLSHEMGDSGMWFVWPKILYLWTWFFYAGVVMVLVGGLYATITYKAMSGPFEFGLNILAVIGTLAFPLFISHEMVLPLSRIFDEVGLPAPLLIAMALFFAPTFYYVNKFYHLYFGRANH